jgi:hypothetical protein
MEASNSGFGKAGVRWNEDVYHRMIDRLCGLGDGIAIIVSSRLALPVGGRVGDLESPERILPRVIAMQR